MLETAATISKKRKYGHSYADGIAVGVGCVADAQDGATSPEVDHMVTHTPTAVGHLPGAQEAATWRSDADGNAVGVC